METEKREIRDVRLFGYTTAKNFKSLLAIMKLEGVSQSALLHILVEKLVLQYRMGCLQGKTYSMPGAPKIKKTMTILPLKKKRTLRY